MNKIVFLNGKFISEPKALVPASCGGILSGFGVFETMRARENRIVYLREHLRRIKKSCAKLGIACPYSPSRIEKAVRKLVSINGIKDARVRLTIWKNKNQALVLISAEKYRSLPSWQYRRGFGASISALRQNEWPFLARIKSTSYLFYQLAYAQARRRGFQEALILNARGYLAEASRSNIFFVQGGELFTPDLNCGCLDGITRRAILQLAEKQGIAVNQGRFIPADIFSSKEAFLTNSLIGVMPLTAIEKRKINNGLPGRLTRYFMKEYNNLSKCPPEK